jgi:uncharacterized protein (DUF4415 family)
MKVLGEAPVSTHDQNFDDIELWDNRALGADSEHVIESVMPLGLQNQLNKANNMQMISIRLPRDLIDDLKMVGESQNLGYQSLIREVLKRFAASEKKIMIIQLLKQRDELEKQLLQAEKLIEVGKVSKRNVREKKTA